MNKLSRYRNRIHKSLFESEDTQSALSDLGNPLSALECLIDFELFRPLLEESLLKKDRKNNAGRKAIDPVLMFKVLFLATLLRSWRPPDPVSDSGSCELPRVPWHRER